jgi:hypothetical protein
MDAVGHLQRGEGHWDGVLYFELQWHTEETVECKE